MKINLANLNEGLNELQFQIKPDEMGFDKKEETSLLFPNNIEANVEVQKFSDKFFLKVNLITKAHFTCDRCLDEFDQNLEADFQLIYSKQVRNQFKDDVYRFLDESTVEIDLSEDIRENLLLVLPMKQLCSEECAGLCSQCGVNLNYDTCKCDHTIIDPRWESLKNLQ